MSDLDPQIPNENELPQVVEFLNENLRTNAAWSIADEYPLVFTSNNRNNIRIIKSHDKVIGHAAIKYHLVKNVLGVFKVAAIGSVLTSPDHRQQGVAQKIIEECVIAAYKEGADFAILWTDLFDFYRKMNFELAGQEISMLIDKEIEAPNTLKILKSHRVAAESISKLYVKHTVGSIRSAEEIRKFLAIPGARVYTAWDQSQQVRAYAVEGKGVDLDAYIHEWGGDVPALIELFAYMRRDQNRPLVAMAPATSENLIRELNKLGVNANRGYLGMIRILHHENLFAKLQRYAKSLGIDDFEIYKENNQYVIHRGDKEMRTEDLKILTRLIFGPHDFGQDVSILNPILPIPMWIWGWDSV